MGGATKKTYRKSPDPFPGGRGLGTRLLDTRPSFVRGHVRVWGRDYAERNEATCILRRGFKTISEMAGGCRRGRISVAAAYLCMLVSAGELVDVLL